MSRPRADGEAEDDAGEALMQTLRASAVPHEVAGKSIDVRLQVEPFAVRSDIVRFEQQIVRQTLLEANHPVLCSRRVELIDQACNASAGTYQAAARIDLETHSERSRKSRAIRVSWHIGEARRIGVLNRQSGRCVLRCVGAAGSG